MISRVLLVDDQPAFRKGLRPMLEEERDLEVVGESDTQIAAAPQFDQGKVVTSRRRLFDQFGVRDLTALAESIRENDALAGNTADKKRCNRPAHRVP